MSDTAVGNLVIMGEITSKRFDGSDRDHHMALLIEFESEDAIQQAIADG